jgi:hypothetical protein
MGKEWLGGTEEDTRPNLAHRRGGWCGVEAGRRELASAAMTEKKTTSARGLKRVQNHTMGGSIVGDATRRQGEHGARQLHGSGGDGHRSGGVWRRVGGGVDGARGLRASAWAAHERVGWPGRKRWAEPRETVTFSIYSN